MNGWMIAGVVLLLLAFALASWLTGWRALQTVAGSLTAIACIVYVIWVLIPSKRVPTVTETIDPQPYMDAVVTNLVPGWWQQPDGEVVKVTLKGREPLHVPLNIMGTGMLSVDFPAGHTMGVYLKRSPSDQEGIDVRQVGVLWEGATYPLLQAASANPADSVALTFQMRSPKDNALRIRTVWSEVVGGSRMPVALGKEGKSTLQPWGVLPVTDHRVESWLYLCVYGPNEDQPTRGPMPFIVIGSETFTWEKAKQLWPATKGHAYTTLVRIPPAASRGGPVAIGVKRPTLLMVTAVVKQRS